jgi:butyryl-CoA dehydrogenase
MDLLGRKVHAEGGEAMRILAESIRDTAMRARRAGVDDDLTSRVQAAFDEVLSVTEHLASLGRSGEPEQMMLHSVDYLDLFSTTIIGWVWLLQATVATEGRSRSDRDRGFYEGKVLAARYWIRTELRKVGPLAALCREGEDSYARLEPDWI